MHATPTEATGDCSTGRSKLGVPEWYVAQVQLPDLLGYFAATMTTVAFVPQAWKTFRTRDTRGLSGHMYAVFTLGVAAWLAYGVLKNDWPIILANAVTLVLACAVLVMKLIFGEVEASSVSVGGAAPQPGGDLEGNTSVH